MRWFYPIAVRLLVQYLSILQTTPGKKKKDRDLDQQHRQGILRRNGVYQRHDPFPCYGSHQYSLTDTKCRDQKIPIVRSNRQICGRIQCSTAKKLSAKTNASQYRYRYQQLQKFADEKQNKNTNYKRIARQKCVLLNTPVIFSRHRFIKTRLT